MQPEGIFIKNSEDLNTFEARILKLKMTKTIVENNLSVSVQSPRLSVVSGAEDRT